MMTASCIFCRTSDHFETVEHIIPRSLGNLHYILPKGLVCSRCNNNFAKFENRVLSSVLFIQERRRYGLLRERNQIKGNTLTNADLKKFLGKMAFESLYKSRRKFWKTIDFSDLLNLLLKGQDSELISVKKEVQLSFRSIPRWLDRFRLRNNHLQLEMGVIEESLYFRFQFGQIRSILQITQRAKIDLSAPM